MSSPADHAAGSGPAPLRRSLVLTRRALLAVDGVDIMTEMIAQGMACNPAATETWRNLVIKDLSFFSSPISEEIRDQGRAQARAEDLLIVLEQRGLDVPDAVRERVTGCDDPAGLRRWLTRAVTAPEAEDIFGNE